MKEILFSLFFVLIHSTEENFSYIGCFQYNHEDLLFVFAPGDYDVSSVTPLSCAYLCSPDFKYSTVRAEGSCFCNNDINITSLVNDSYCSTQCIQSHEGYALRHCDVWYSLVYMSMQGITGLKLKVPETVGLLSKTWISASVLEKDGVLFRFEIDNKVVVPFSTSSNISYVFKEKGEHLVGITARNRLSTVISLHQMVEVNDMLSDVQLHCPTSSLPGKEISCKGVWDRGNIPVTFDFGDGLYQKMSLDTPIFKVGPTINQSQEVVEMESVFSRIFVLPSAIIPENGEISHWEILAAKSGKIKIQIFRPFCDPINQHHCQNLTTNTSSEDVETTTCDSLRCICLSKRECVPVNNVQRLPYTCTEIRDNGTYIDTDYKLVSEYVLDIHSVGYHVFTIPQDKRPTVSGGDVIGWSSDGGHLARIADINPVYDYPGIGSPGLTLLRDKFSKVSFGTYALCGYIRQPIKFELSHTYTRTGVYQVSSPSTATLSVKIQHIITPFTINLPRTLTTNTTNILRVGKHNGSFVTYKWDFGDGTETNSSIPETTHTYHYPGWYTITLSATNAVSNYTLRSNHEVLNPIKNCHFKQPITAVILGKPSFLEWECQSGSNVTFLVNFGDESTKVLQSKSKEVIGNNITHLYSAIGNFSVNILTFSLVGPNNSFTEQAFVEIPISGLELHLLSPAPSPLLYIASFSVIKLGHVMLNGTHANCLYKFGDSTARVVSMTSHVNHTYHTPGVYHVNITCSNHVSSMSVALNSTIIVHDIQPINKLTVNVSSTLLGTPSIFTLSITGNLFKCCLDFGDGHTQDIAFPLVGGNISHSYHQVGTYTVNVTCRNDIGFSSVITAANVDAPIRKATILNVHNYVRVHQQVQLFLKWDQGTRVSYCIDCKHNSSGVRVSNNVTMVIIKYVYSKPGKYDIVVKLWNTVSSVVVTHPEPIVVEYPVTGLQFFTVAPSRCSSESISFCLNVSRDTPQPSNASVLFNFGDGTHTFLRNVDFTHTFCFQKHDYHFAGVHDVTVNVTNLVSSQLLNISAYVSQKQLPGITAVYYNGSVFRHGLGPKNQYFPLGTSIRFVLPRDLDDVAFEWNIGNVLLNATNEYTFKMSGCYNVRAVIKNTKLEEHCFTLICVQKEINEIYFSVKLPTFFNEYTLFSFSSKNDASSCFLLSFGDNTTIRFGDVSCGFSYQNLANYSHLYKVKGQYTVNLIAWNNVSSVQRSIEVGVWDEACPYPRIHISGGGPQRQPRVLENVKEVVFEPVVLKKCLIAEFMVIKWELFIVGHDDGNEKPFRTLSRELRISGNSTDNKEVNFPISVRTLPTESFMVKLNVKFTSSEREISHVNGTNYTWFSLSRSQLVARIKGGIFYSISYNSSLVLDGRESYDPDEIFDINSLMFSWTCRPLNTTLNSNNSTDCFKNKSFTFSNANIISFSTADHLLPQVYIFSLEVKEGTRKSTFQQTVVVIDDPIPRIDIRCVINCEERMNPSQRLVLQSQCINYKIGTRLHYKWSLYTCSVHNTTARSSCKEIFNFEKQTSTGVNVANLVTLPNVLQVNTIYRVRCSSWRPAKEHAVGFVEYQFTVNSPPSGGHCMVEPTIGEAMVTQFNINCLDWNDDDQPLTYLVEIKTSTNTLLISSGNQGNTTMLLPGGKPENNYTIEVIVKVVDSMLFSTSSLHIVQVFEPRSLNYGEVVNDLETTIRNEDNINIGFGVVISLCSIMNNKHHLFKQNISVAKKTRAKLAKLLSEVNVTSFNEVRGLGTSLQTLSAKADEVAVETQNEITKNLQNKMAAFNRLSQGSRDMIGIGTSLHTVMSNIIEAALFQSVVNITNEIKDQNNTTNTTAFFSSIKEMKPETINEALFTIDEINNVILGQVVAGDRPAVIETKNFNVHLTRKHLEDFTRDNDETADLAVKFQDVASFLENNNLTLLSVLGCLITDLSKNFVTFNSSEELNSNILRVNMKGVQGPSVDLAMLDVEVMTQSNITQPNISQISTWDSQKTLQIHTFNRTIGNTALVLQFEPVDATPSLRAFLSIGKQPSLKRYDFRTDFPKKNKTSGMSSYTWVLSHDLLLNFTFPDFQQYFVGVEILDQETTVNYTLRVSWAKCFILENEEGVWDSMGCKVGLRTNLFQTHCICRPGQPDLSSGHDRLKRRTRRDSPNSGGLPRPSWRKEVFKISIGAGVFPAPNKIDFQYVFDVNVKDNPLALIAVVSVFGLFLLLLIYARRQDCKDVEKFGVTPLQDNNASDKYFYEITIYTGSSYNAGTTANVSIIITGQDKEVQPRALYHPKRKCFQRGGIDTFLLSSPDVIGNITYLQIWHNNAGSNPAWLLDKVLIRDLNEKKSYLFLNETWLAVEKGQGSVQTVLFPASQEEMTSFKLLFNTTTQRNLKDRHLWFSVFTRPVDSRFTRVQRLACCLTLLYSTMLVNAMFYQRGGTDTMESTLTIGPFRFGLNELGIGLMSALIILPFNALLVWVFRNIEAKPSAENLRIMKEKSKIWWLYELFFCCYNNRNSDVGFVAIFSRITTDYFHTNNDDEKLKQDHDVKVLFRSEDNLINDIDLDLEITETPTKRKKLKKLATSIKLPYCYIYIAWFFFTLVCITCAFFVVLYGLQFGKDLSARWLSSMTISFFQDVLISEPLKVFAIAAVVALIIKKPQKIDGLEKQEKEFTDYQQWIDKNNDKENTVTLPPDIKPPNKKELEKARTKRLKELKMTYLLKELVLYMLFIVCLSTTTYKNKNPISYQVKKVMADIFVHNVATGKSFTQIKDINGFYSWLNDTLISGIFSSSLWYNHEVYPEGIGTVALGNLYLIGKARIRQTRVKQNSCFVPKYFHKMIKKCHGSYSKTNKDTKCYGVAWTPIVNRSLCNSFSSPDPWRFLSSSEQKSKNLKIISSPHDDGYMFELSRANQTKSNELIALLKANNWVDERTREISIELNLYSGSLNLFCLGNLIIKFHPTNGITKHSSFMITKLFALSGVLDSYSVISHLFIFFFFLILAYREAKQIYRLKQKYFSSFWNCLQCLIILLTTSCIPVFFLRLLKIEQLLASLEKHGDVISFNHVASIDKTFGHMIAVVVFLSWLCMIKLLRFNRRLLFLQETLRRIVKPLKAFSVVFLTLFAAYLHSGYLIFSRDLPTFRDLFTTFVSLISLFMGHLDFVSYEGSNRILGPLYLFAVMFVGVFIFVNLFIALILESFMSVKLDATKKENEYEILEFVTSQLCSWLGITRSQAPRNEPRTPKPPESKHKNTVQWNKTHSANENVGVFSKTFQSVERLEDMYEVISQEDWDEELGVYKLFLLGQTNCDWSREANEEFIEFWEELEKLPSVPWYLGEKKSRDKFDTDVCDGIELSDFKVVIEDEENRL